MSRCTFDRRQLRTTQNHRGHGRQCMTGDGHDLTEQKLHLVRSDLNQVCVGGSLSSDSLGGSGRWDTIQRLIRIMQPVTTTTNPNVMSMNSMFQPRARVSQTHCAKTPTINAAKNAK